MHDSRNSDGSVLVIAVVLILLLVAGGGATFMWQRQRAMATREVALMRLEQAEVEVAQARALAEQQLTETIQTDRAVAEPPNGIGDDSNSMEASIRTVLQTQQRAWNEGDIDRFMESYWNSEDLTFSSGGKLTQGWQGTLENYKKKYASRAEMGKLTFANLEVTPLSKEAALVLGEWQLSRDSEDLGGNFTLVFRRQGDTWVIVHDHTSRAEEP